MPGRGHVRQHVHDQQGQGPDGRQVEEHVEGSGPGQPEAGEQRQADEHLQRQRALRHAGGRRHAAEAAGGQTVPPERKHHAGGDGHPAQPGAERAEHRPEVEQRSESPSHVSFGKLTERRL